MESFEECAESILPLAKLFGAAHGPRFKNAFADALAVLVLQVADQASAELHHPTWSEIVDALWPRALAMSAKPRYASSSLSLGTALLCASKEDFFLAQWWTWAESAFQNLKEKNKRKELLECACRLFWTYLFRCKESSNATSRRVEAFSRMVLPAQKKGSDAPEPGIELQALMLHHLLYRQADLGRDLVLDLLRSASLQGNALTLQPELINRPRMTAAIRAVVLTKQAYATSTSPAFPFSLSDIVSLPADGIRDVEYPTQAIGQAFATFEDLLGKIALICDHQVKDLSVFGDKIAFFTGNTTSNTIDPEVSEFDREGTVLRYHETMRITTAYPGAQQPFLDVLRVCLEAWPVSLTSKLSSVSSSTVMIGALFSADPSVGSAAASALLRCAARTELATSAVLSLGRRLLQPEATLWEGHPHQKSITSKIVSIGQLWLEMLDVWVKSNKLSDDDTPSTAGRAATWNALEELEAQALAMTANPLVMVRRTAYSAMRCLAELDASLTGRQAAASLEDATRAAHILDMPVARALSNDEQVQQLRCSAHIEAVLQARDSVESVAWQDIQAAFFRLCAASLPTVVAYVKPMLAARFAALDRHFFGVGVSPTARNAVFYHADTASLSWTATAGCLLALSTDAELPATRQQQHQRGSSDGAIDVSDITGPAVVKSLLIRAAGGQHQESDMAIKALSGMHPRLFYVFLTESHKMAQEAVDENKRLGTLRHDTNGLRQQSVRRANALLLKNLMPYFPKLDGSQRANGIFHILAWVKETQTLLADNAARADLSHNQLRLSYAVVLSIFLDSLGGAEGAARFFSPDSLLQAFQLCQDWQSYSPFSPTGPSKLAELLTSAAYRHNDQSRSRALNELREQVHELAFAAGRAMASLLAHIPCGLAAGRDVATDLSWAIELLKGDQENVRVVAE